MNCDDTNGVTASDAAKMTFAEWWENHGKHNATWTAPHAPGEIERRKELMKLAWDVALADGVDLPDGGQRG